VKEHSVSQSIAYPTSTIPIDIQPSARELMTDWLQERVQRAIDIVEDAAMRSNISVRDISVFGTDYFDDLYRQIFVWVNVDADANDAYAYWGDLAGPIRKLNQPPPPGAQNSDVRLEVSVNW